MNQKNITIHKDNTMGNTSKVTNNLNSHFKFDDFKR